MTDSGIAALLGNLVFEASHHAFVDRFHFCDRCGRSGNDDDGDGHPAPGFRAASCPSIQATRSTRFFFPRIETKRKTVAKSQPVPAHLFVNIGEGERHRNSYPASGQWPADPGSRAGHFGEAMDACVDRLLELRVYAMLTCSTENRFSQRPGLSFSSCR